MFPLTPNGFACSELNNRNCRTMTFLMAVMLLSTAPATQAEVNGLSTGSPIPSPSPAQSITYASSRTLCWQKDLDYLEWALPEHQKDFTVLMPKYELSRRIAEIKQDIPKISDSDIVLRLVRLIASLNVAHTQLDLGAAVRQFGLHFYPIQFDWFGNDLVVVAALPRDKEAVGCRILRINSRPPLQVETLLAPYISHENYARLHRKSPGMMTIAELMKYEKLVDETGRLQLTCIKTDGKEFTVDVVPMLTPAKHIDLLGIREVYKLAPRLSNKRPNTFYWYDYLPESQTLYVQYNSCHDDPKKSFQDFSYEVINAADTHPVQRMIVDLRYNSGGSTSIIKPLFEKLKARPALCSRGHLYVLIGEGTFSAGMDNAVSFRTTFNAILVGESASNSPYHYGEMDSFVLPNSQLRVTYAKKYIRMGHHSGGGDPKDLSPEIYVPPTLADRLAGRDAVFETVLRQPVK